MAFSFHNKHLTKSIIISVFLFLCTLSCARKESELYHFQVEQLLGVKNAKDIKIKMPGDKSGVSGLAPYNEEDIYNGKKIEYHHHIQKYPDSIVAIFDINNSGCMTISPITEILKDTLSLSYKFESDGCKEEEVYRLKYVIKNSGKVKFIRFANRIFHL